ncbi:MAG TPA: AsmA family protein [Candidatus Xenobia bacterium]|nr:AsmA family protein [Candidatus Xenobia bacterium]
MAAWYRKKIVIIAGVVVVGLVLALLLVPYLIDIDNYRAAIVEQAEKATGREVEIDKLRLHILPSIHVAASNFRLKNPRDFPEGDFVRVESVGIGLGLGALLRKQVEVTSASLDGVEVNLLTNEQGRTNSEFSTPGGNPGGARGGAAPPGGFALRPISSISLSDITINSGSVSRRRVVPSWTLTGLELEVRGLDPLAPNPLKSVETEVDLSSVEVSSPSLKEPLRFKDGEIKVAAGAADGNFSAALGKLRAEGTVKIANLDKPVADFTLAMNELNTDELAALLGGAAPAGPRGGRGELLARGSLSVEKLVAPPLSARNVKGQARVYDNRISIDPFSLELFGGRTRGSLGISTADPSMPASVTARVEGVNVKQALETLNPGGKNKITGTFEADARLGLPLGARDPLSALSGQGTFAIRNGTVPGMNIRSAAATMASLVQVDLPQGDIPFSYLGGDFRIAERRVHNSHVELKSDQVEATASGSFGFDQTLSYNGLGSIKGRGTTTQQQETSPTKIFGRILGSVARQTVNISGARVPFAIRGTFADPKFTITGPPVPIPIR